MDAVQILNNEYATLIYHPDAKIVHHEFHKPIPSDVFRQVLNEGSEVFKKYGAHKWLSDDRKNGALSDEDTHWAKTDWFPRVLEAGWQHWALVWPPDILAVINLTEFVNTYRRFGLRVMVFNDPKYAMPWLIKAKEIPKAQKTAMS